MSVVARKFKLTDGTSITCDEMTAKTGWSRGTCYARLTKTDDHIELYKPVALTQKGRVYILDDGSEWTSKSLAKHLGCKRSTAGTRLALMKGDSKRILSPPRDASYYDEQASNHKEVQLEVEKRMLWDKQGHWKLINKNT